MKNTNGDIHGALTKSAEPEERHPERGTRSAAWRLNLAP